ncbi:MAG: hypothetical protein MI746_13900 [Pseudomonadales bacterium]|nr:hypothetical protein [Pseudomonadales bacterium]
MSTSMNTAMNPSRALFWYCWQRTRYAVALQLLAAIGFGVLFLVYLTPNEGLANARGNIVILITLITSWLLSAVMSATLVQNRSLSVGFGFPLKSEYHYPISTIRLVTIALSYVVSVSYLGFLLPVVVLGVVFDLPFPHGPIHFMVFEYLLLMTSLSWFSNHGPESLAATVVIIFLFYFELIIPEFALEEGTGAFLPGPWSTTIAPALITVASVAILILGVHKQRSGENLVFRSGTSVNLVESLSTLSLFRFVTTACPTKSGTAAMIWRERQSLGLQASVGIGVTIGALVVLLLSFLQYREFADVGQYRLDTVSGFSFIFYCTVFVGVLATMFGIDFRHGEARVSVFDRTLPMSTARAVVIRAGMAFHCLLVAGAVQIVTIGLLGPLTIENFASVRAEFFQALQAVTDRGFAYSLLRAILFLCLIYIWAMLWAVLITWYSMKTRLVAWLSSGLMIYGIVLVTALTAITDGGQEFLRLSNAMTEFHSLIIVTAIIGSMIYLVHALLKDEVITPLQVTIIFVIGLALCALQVIDLNLNSDLDPNSPMLNRLRSQVAGLLPLTATLLALWTQNQLRHR